MSGSSPGLRIVGVIYRQRKKLPEPAKKPAAQLSYRYSQGVLLRIALIGELAELPEWLIRA